MKFSRHSNEQVAHPQPSSTNRMESFCAVGGCTEVIMTITESIYRLRNFVRLLAIALGGFLFIAGLMFVVVVLGA